MSRIHKNPNSIGNRRIHEHIDEFGIFIKEEFRNYGVGGVTNLSRLLRSVSSWTGTGGLCGVRERALQNSIAKSLLFLSGRFELHISSAISSDRLIFRLFR